MSKRNWWRAAALGAAGASIGGWFGLAQADPIPFTKVENTVWSRAVPVTTVPAAPVAPASASVPGPISIPPSTDPPPLAKPATPAPTKLPESVITPEFRAAPSIPPSVVEPSKPPAIPIPPPKVVAPPAQPAKSADPVQTVPTTSPDFNLRPGNTGNSVKPRGTSAVLPPLPIIPPATTAPVEPIKAPPFTSATRPKPVEGAMPATEKFVFPIPARPGSIPAVPAAIERSVPANPNPITTIPTPGDDPMKLKQATIATVIGGALAMMSITPAEAVPLPPKAVTPAITVPALPAAPVGVDAASDLAELKTKLDTANQKLADAQKDIKRLTELLEGIKDQPTIPGLVRDVRDLKDKVFIQGEKIAALEKQLDEMKKSTSLRPALPADPMAGKGIVRIVNEYPVEIALVVNNLTYRVAPNTKLDVTVPMGDFTYLLLNAASTAAAPVKSPIKEKEVVTLRIK
jgi:hypothetical protein